jgi:hypothetical protein
LYDNLAVCTSGDKSTVNIVKELEGNIETEFDEIDCGERNWMELVQN